MKKAKLIKTGCDLLERPENKNLIEELEGAIEETLETKLGVRIERGTNFPTCVIWEVSRGSHKKGLHTEVTFDSQTGWKMLVRKPLP